MGPFQVIKHSDRYTELLSLSLSLYSFLNLLFPPVSLSLLPAYTLSSFLHSLHHLLPSVPLLSPSLPKSPSIHPSLSASLPPSHLSLSLSKGNIIENLAGTPKIESGQGEREREKCRAEESERAKERESIRAKKRGKERRRARTKTLSHLIFGWRFLFAVNNLSLPLSSACSASDRHIYLMQMSIKYVEKKEKEQWLFKNDTYKLSLLRIRKPSCHSCLQVRKTNREKKHYISVLLFTGDCRSTPR